MGWDADPAPDIGPENTPIVFSPSMPYACRVGFRRIGSARRKPMSYLIGIGGRAVKPQMNDQARDAHPCVAIRFGPLTSGTAHIASPPNLIVVVSILLGSERGNLPNREARLRESEIRRTFYLWVSYKFVRCSEFHARCCRHRDGPSLPASSALRMVRDLGPLVGHTRQADIRERR